MMPMFTRGAILVFAVFVFVAGCSSRSRSGKDMDLLTVHPWKYEKAGFNGDEASFDALDPRISGNEKDNIIIFCKDGTGYSQFTHHNRTGNNESLPFTWALQNDSTIYFQNQYYKVRVLTPQRLEIYADQHLGATNTRYTIILKR